MSNDSSLTEIDHYFESQVEPFKGCLLALRKIILSLPDVTEAWRYKMPFYCFRKKRFCYLWLDKKRKLPYLGIVDGHKVNHPELVMDKRSKMKILLIDPAIDLPVKKIKVILTLAIDQLSV